MGNLLLNSRGEKYNNKNNCTPTSPQRKKKENKHRELLYIESEAAIGKQISQQN